MPTPKRDANRILAWTETASLSFTARHEAGQSEAAVSVLEALESHRARLEELFPRVPGNVTVVLHDSALQLALAQPYLPIARRFAAPASRRYMAGWFARNEIHLLSPQLLRKLAGGPDSLNALLLTPERTYTLLVVGANNPLLPPPFRPAAFAALMRRAWLAEGAAQHFSGQLVHLRAAISTRLREGVGRNARSRISFPPRRRDAALLGGSVFDLLARERGEPACVRLACHPDPGEPRAALEEAFESPLRDVERRWREHLEQLARPATAGARPSPAP